MFFKLFIPKSVQKCKKKPRLKNAPAILLNKFYNNILESLKEADTHLSSPKNDNYTQKPGWTEYVSELYNYSKSCYRNWREANEPRHGSIHEQYVKSKARFKFALRFISRNEDRMRKEAMAKNLANKKTSEFWKEVSAANNYKTPLPDNINEACGSEEIINLWKKHFYDIFNCLKSNNIEQPKPDLNDSIDKILVSPSMVTDAIKNLSMNKSCGLDGITAEHLKYASERLPYLLSMCITSFFTHGFLPESMLSVLIVPVIKDKAGNINAKDNYRPIALASIISKIVEMIMLDRLETYLLTQPNQFGFKKKHGTDQCIFALKELINKYKSGGSCISVYILAF